ncbi:hypothetical protein BD289DRAFT_57503 [Coniella lustricola]|uniref:Secreted protein n=1 Tax=Coniella lustricola TaxID=2025994 RepID=A0A2T3AI76_9PEZI|nr:hypothetical protein BD289DRAFT_57503 [Coniella lustricola]
MYLQRHCTVFFFFLFLSCVSVHRCAAAEVALFVTVLLLLSLLLVTYRRIRGTGFCSIQSASGMQSIYPPTNGGKGNGNGRMQGNKHCDYTIAHKAVQKESRQKKKDNEICNIGVLFLYFLDDVYVTRMYVLWRAAFPDSLCPHVVTLLSFSIEIPCDLQAETSSRPMPSVQKSFRSRVRGMNRLFDAFTTHRLLAFLL